MERNVRSEAGKAHEGSVSWEGRAVSGSWSNAKNAMWRLSQQNPAHEPKMTPYAT